jgi:transaldolase
VASVFVSRIDTAVDKLLDEAVSRERSLGEKEKLVSLKGKAAVANSLIQYERHHKLFSTRRFERLRGEGVNYQRVLWGSTSTKNPSYSDIKYIQELLLKDTVNTIPEDTLKAFLDHGEVREAPHQASQARKILKTLEESGISIDAVCSRLLSEGVASFSKSFESLLSAIESKAHKLAMKG